MFPAAKYCSVDNTVEENQHIIVTGAKRRKAFGIVYSYPVAFDCVWTLRTPKGKAVSLVMYPTRFPYNSTGCVTIYTGVYNSLSNSNTQELRRSCFDVAFDILFVGKLSVRTRGSGKMFVAYLYSEPSRKHRLYKS